jgi:L-lactate dehydrogenase complex protein LldG
MAGAAGMSAARDRILGTVRKALQGADEPGRHAAVEARIGAKRPNLVPKRAQLPAEEQVDLFEKKAIELFATVERVGRLAEIPGRVADWLAGHNLPSRLKISPDPALDRIPWADRPMLAIEKGAAAIEDTASVTPAFAAIAETGTLMMRSSADRPSTLNFVPDNHIVVLHRDQVTGTLEQALERLRQFSPEMPRTLNLISGPSRTADIEQQMIMGAHGPRRLHVILVDEPFA